jgi:type II protein arginine methyltransferase
MNQTPLLQAFEHFQAGRLERAAELLRQHLKQSPSDGPANHLLGSIYYRQGRLIEARDHQQRACSAPGATAEMFNNLGAFQKALGDDRGAVASYQRALALDPNHVETLNNLGVIYRAQRNTRKAIEILRRAVALKPDYPESQKNLRNAYNDIIPAWHFAMVNDRPRNDAYQAAIARAAPGKRVLDVGTGSGLLAMMAARAGAKSVTSCEANEVIAERACDIIALNGLADRIKVIAKHSSALSAGGEFPERAEVLITETFSSDLLSEGILSTIEHAHRYLLTPDAAVIPRVASAMAYLAGGAEIEMLLYAGSSNGFDLSPFNEFAPVLLAAGMNNVTHNVLSDDFELFSFDLRAKLFGMDSRMLTIPVLKSGVVAAVVQWIKLDLDGISRYENRPWSSAEAESHWTHILYRLPRPIAVQAGETVRLWIGHNREQISVRPAD